MRLLTISFAAFVGILPAATVAATPEGRRAAEQALDMLGGAEKLRGVSTVRLHAMVVTNAIEQSNRPEGPYFDTYSDLVETRWLDRLALLSEARRRGAASPWWLRAEWTPSAFLVQQGAAFAIRGGKPVPGSPAIVATAEESLALGPERVLLNGLAAPDLRLETQRSLHSHMHDVLAFTWKGVPVRVLLLASNRMPVAVEYSRARPLNVLFAPWGDVDTRVEWEGWVLEPNGIVYPRRWQTFVNGFPYETRTIDQVDFDPSDAAGFALDVKQVEAARASGAAQASRLHFRANPVDVAPGIRLYPGAWNVAAITIGDETYVLEAPISSAFSADVIQRLSADGRHLAGVITTSDSWPHIGGIREYVAQQIPVTALDLNAPILKRLIAAPFRTLPDSLAKRPTRPSLNIVSKPTDIGSGNERMRLIPFRSASGERQMAIYWPAHRLLYTSDIMTAARGQVWMPQYRSEVAELIRRERLDVERVFGMHYAPMRWDEVQRLPGMAP